MEKAKSLHARLLAAAGPSGYEDGGREVIKELAKPYSDEMSTDVIGNLIVRQRGSGKRIMLAAHCDVIGFMVYRIEEGGFLGVQPIGGHTACFLPNTSVRFLNGVRGVISVRNRDASLGKSMRDIKMGDLYVDIGVRDRASAEAKIRVGDVCVFEGTHSELLNNRVASPYMDDLIGCTALLLTMEELHGSGLDVSYVFSAQEEAGVRGCGVFAASYTIEPDYGLAVDVCGSGDSPAVGERLPVVLGGGPALGYMDASTIGNLEVLELLKKAAEDSGIAVQSEVAASGGTDAGAIQKTRGGIAAGTVSIPTRNIHTPQEIVDMADVCATAQLLAAFVRLAGKENA